MAKTFNSFSAILIGVTCMVASTCMATATGPSAIYIFGDSTVDVGTNNFLNGTTALANFPYNGVDFPGSIPTGRFCNGYNIADQLARMLLEYESSPLPYLYLVNNTSPTSSLNFSQEILKGVNFGSGGSGILNHTGEKLWNVVVPMRDQVQQFGLVRGSISKLMGEDETSKFLSKSIFILSMGSNDIFDNFRLNLNYTKEQLISTLHSAYYQHLKDLINLGARKFGILSAGPIGCSPYARAVNKYISGNGGCLKEPNQFAKAFYPSLHTLLRNISSECPQVKYSLGNVYDMTKYVLRNSRSLGFNEIKAACCGSGYDNGEGFCNKQQNASLCESRNQYLFWDLYHPTAVAYNLSALTLVYGGTNFVKPINFGALAQL